MRRKVNRFPDELALKIATEFVTTNATIKELQEKYGFKGVGSLYNWIRKFGLSKPNEETIKVNQIMAIEKSKSSRETALEQEVEKLKKQLELEKLKNKAYQKMIEIAERDLSISIKKKSGCKQ